MEETESPHRILKLSDQRLLLFSFQSIQLNTK